MVDIRWSNTPKIMHFHLSILTKPFFIDSSHNRVSHIMQVPAGHVCLIFSGEASFILQFSSETSLLAVFWKKIKLLSSLSSVVSYVFVHFGGAYGNACTIIFTFNYPLYRRGCAISWLTIQRFTIQRCTIHA